MATKSAGLLAELEAGLRNGRTTTTLLLQKCILLGGQVGSERLRDWARQELRGYDEQSEVPEYRHITAPLCIDGATFNALIEGQQISSMALPDYAREYINERLTLTQGVGELEDLSRGSKDAVRLSPPGAQDLVMLMNHENRSGDQITRLYWKVSRTAFVGVVTGIRTALAELVGELLAAAPDGDQAPSKEAADAAVHFLVTGNRNTVTVVGSQSATSGNATVTVTSNSVSPAADQESWWQRWRKRGLIIGVSTVVAAVAAVLQLYGWVPWK